MEPKDLKNSEELERQLNDDFEKKDETSKTDDSDDLPTVIENPVEDDAVLENTDIAEEAPVEKTQAKDVTLPLVEDATVSDDVADEASGVLEEIVELDASVESDESSVARTVEKEDAAVPVKVDEEAEEPVELVNELVKQDSQPVEQPAAPAVEEDIPEDLPENAGASLPPQVEESEGEKLEEKPIEVTENKEDVDVSGEKEDVDVEDTPKTEQPPAAVKEAVTDNPEENVVEVPENKEDVDVSGEKEDVDGEEAPKTEQQPAVTKEAEPEEADKKEDDKSDKPEIDEGDHDEDEQTDYMEFSQIELVNTLRELIDGGETRDRKINLIIAAFNQKVKQNIADSKKQFIDEGGKADDFVVEEDPYEQDIRELVKRHRQAKFELAKKMEAEKEINLQKKYTIIEDIKNLLNTEESINKTFQEFRELQKDWYEIGPVPQAKMKDLWDTYHFHVENFYDYIKINKELRDLDLKKNLEVKIELCEKAEELLLEPSVIRAFNTLQKYHEQWREVGPVPRDKRDDIWDRFKAVTTAINQKHQEFFEKRKGEQKRNLEAKIALCEKAEEIGAMTIDTHRVWDEKSKELIELQKVWRTIGFAPKRDNNKIYDRFRKACDNFFNKKREYYAQSKDIQNKNLQMKIDLCLEAEALKDNNDWKKTTQDFIDIQKRWKEIGPVPRKHSDSLWKRFRAACDHFFNRKSDHFSDVDDEQVENLRLKKELIDEVNNFTPENDVNEALKVLKDFQRRWTEIGHVPIREKESLQNQFRTAINKHFDTLKLDSGKRDSLKFRSKIATMAENQRGLSKVRTEREKYMSKLKQLENDLTLLDNNIGFFANSKNAQALIADVNQKIEDTRQKIEMLKDKIRIIDELDKNEY
jgi:hypothetical protein